MAYLYKHSNRMWRFLIRHELTAWSPLVEWTRRRHFSFRRRLARRTGEARFGPAPASAGV